MSPGDLFYIRKVDTKYGPGPKIFHSQELEKVFLVIGRDGSMIKYIGVDGKICQFKIGSYFYIYSELIT